MSGIAGFIHFDGQQADAAVLDGMTTTMRYRGPDGIRTWHRGPAALGYCALVTTAEQLAEAQPLEDPPGELVLVFDGRLDNRPELRHELLASGARLRDETDAEFVLQAYERWREDCVVHLDGEFALVVWDPRTRSVFCARDRMGLRPFHYHWNGRTFAFASDVHALFTLPWVPQHLNAGMVAEVLAVEHHCVRDTFWEGVLRLPAATCATTTTQGVRERRYWEPDPAFRLPCRSDTDYVVYHRELLHEVVQRQSRSHQPLACEVSGGLDSSAIFAVMHALRLDVQGFALDFSDELADESAYQEVLSGFMGATIDRVAPGTYPVSWYRDFGAAYRDFAGFPNWTMMRPLYAAARARGCTVVFNGTGGDEWLGSVYGVQGSGLAALLRWYGWELLPERWKDWVRYWRGLPVPSAWLSPGLSRTLRQRRARAESQSEDVWELELAMLRDADSQFGRELAQRQAAMCGIERRQPFWDRRIVEAAFATPEWLRARDDEDKWLHRRTMEGLLPPAILQRRDKANFRVMARQQRTELTNALQSTLTRRSSWVRPERVRPPAEYLGSGALADFGQWALLMADALEPPSVAHRSL